MKKKILCLLLALLVINLSIPHVTLATELPTSGPCGAEGDGSNVTWNLDSDGTLTVSGSGKMKDYSSTNRAPWYEHINKIKSVTITSGVTFIGSYAFEGCDSLTSVTIEKGVTLIGISAFENCTNLTSVTIPDSVTYISGNAFDNTPWLEEKQNKNPLVVVNNILIDGKAAEGEVSIPKDVTSIVAYAFRNCEKLISVTIPNSVTYIGYHAFYGCSSLTSITIPDSVASIEAGTFNGCTSLTSVTIPKSVTSIGNNAFEGCNSLETVFYFKEKTYSNVTFPAEVARIAYKVNDEQDELDTKTQVTLVSTSKDVTIKCNAMGEGYEITENSTTSAPEKVTIAHDWDDGTVKKEPTCTVCKATKEETIHTFSKEWSSNDKEHWHACKCGARQDEGQHDSNWEHNSAEHWKVCSICKKETDKASHSFYKVIFAPTEDKLGGTKYTCKDCGYVYWKDFKRGVTWPLRFLCQMMRKFTFIVSVMV